MADHHYTGYDSNQKLGSENEIFYYEVMKLEYFASNSIILSSQKSYTNHYAKRNTCCFNDYRLNSTLNLGRPDKNHFKLLPVMKLLLAFKLAHRIPSELGILIT